MVVELKLVQIGSRGESDLDVLRIGVARRDASGIWSVREDSPTPQILAILTDFLALSLQYPQTDMRSAAYNAYGTVLAKTVLLWVSLDSFQLILHPF